MKTFSYTLVTSSTRGGPDAQSAGQECALTLRETLVIEEGPRYSREYTIAADAAGRPSPANALPVD